MEVSSDRINAFAKLYLQLHKMIAAMARRNSRSLKSVQFKQSFHFMIFLACFSFTFWVALTCVGRYKSNPRGTQLRFSKAEDVGANNFPAITVCSTHSMRKVSIYNEEILKKCNIRRYPNLYRSYIKIGTKSTILSI